jgi:2,4-dienoyl-CoA reductase-like NADH-dependent reductase (Old Yellow Enzyme family)
MARFFKYKSTADLSAENARLGIDLRFQDDLSPLSAPLAVGPRTVGNRWCIHPMEGCDGETDGTPGELTLRRYRRFGDGGAKLIWGEACSVNAQGRANPRQIWLNEATKPTFRQMVDDTRKAHRAAIGDDSDLLIGLQLTHSGRYCTGGPVIACDDPLLYGRYKVTKETPLISDDQLSRLVDDYVATAKLAAECGFDFVDVKQCHRYLLNELLGARNRPGPYGGSFENRTRLARSIFQAIRATCPNLILGTRLNVFDAIPFKKGDSGDGIPEPWTAPLANGWGMSESDPFTPDLTEPLKWIAEMRTLGVAVINVTMGNPYAQPHFGRPFEYPPPDGYESPEHPLVGVHRHFSATATIQAANRGFPIVGTGYSYLQEFLPQAAAANVADGRVTIVGVGRATLAQPDWVRQLRDNGKLDRKRVCRTFSYCTAIMREKRNAQGQFATGCPPFDKEAYGEIWKEVQQLAVKPKG